MRSLDLWNVDALVDPAREVVRRCTLVADDGVCRVLALDGGGAARTSRTIDGTGCVAIPGLIDAHVHWGAAAGERWRRDGGPRPGQAEAEFAAFLPAERQACLDLGVTAQKSMGDPTDWILAYREVVPRALSGPRLFAVGPLFTAPGGHPAGTHFRGDDWLIATACRQFAPGQGAAAAAEVAALADRGIDAVKIVIDGGGGTLPCLDRTVAAAIVEAAHARRLVVHCHIGTVDEALVALEVGADILEHLPYAEGTSDWRRLGRALASLGRAVCPTLVVTAGRVPAEVLADQARTVAGWMAAGVAVHVGTDLGNPGLRPGAAVHEEMAWLRRGGFSAGQAIAAATVLPGALLPGPPVGRIADGALADWVVVRGDPLTDPALLTRPELVIQAGRVVAGTKAADVLRVGGGSRGGQG